MFSTSNACKNDLNATVFGHFSTLFGPGENMNRIKLPKHIILFNYGLHYMGRQLNEVLNITAHSLLTYAKMYHAAGHLFVFRETSAQHFFGTDSGDYWMPTPANMLKYNVTNNNTKFCCEPHEDVGNRMYVRDEQLQLLLYQIDPHWRKYILWIDFYRISNQKPVYGSHMETNTRVVYDCTHYSYSAPLQGLLAQSLASIFY